MALIILGFLSLLVFALPAAGQTAGRVTRVVPPASLNRAGQSSTVEPMEAVQWQDEIRTQAEGRTRVVLRDGSILNVGQSSSLKIVQQESPSQVTKLELEYGHVRANVVNQLRANGKFEVHTATAVCGVLGTHFEVEADEEVTQLHVHDGQVDFTDKRNGQNMRLLRGQSAHLLHREGRFQRGMHPRFAARARQRWTTLKEDVAEEMKDRQAERVRQVQEERERRQKEAAEGRKKKQEERKQAQKGKGKKAKK